MDSLEAVQVYAKAGCCPAVGQGVEMPLQACQSLQKQPLRAAANFRTRQAVWRSAPHFPFLGGKGGAEADQGAGLAATRRATSFPLISAPLARPGIVLARPPPRCGQPAPSGGLRA